MTAPTLAFCAHGVPVDLRVEDGTLLCQPCALIEFAAEITCGDCGWTRDDAVRCDSCNVLGCRCEVIPTRELCDRWSGGDLCQDCADSLTCRGRCPDCDPPDPRDR